MVDQRVTDEFIQPKNLPGGHGLFLSRLSPPRQQSRLLVRTRVDDLLNKAVDFPVTLLVAPAGSGKTMALAGFAARCTLPVAWCRMTTDDDPSSLLRHLIAAFRVAGIVQDDRVYAKIISLPSINKALDLLSSELSTILQQDTLLLLDDYHRTDEQPVLRSLIERLVSIQPLHLHIVLSTRYRPTLAFLPTIRARGELYQIEQEDLACTVQEVQALFDQNGRKLSTDVYRMTSFCRGWPLVLHMLATEEHICPMTDEDELSTALPQDTITDHLSLWLESITPLLDTYLQQQVFDEQPAHIQDFLLRTAGLRWFDAEVCKALPVLETTLPHLREIERRSLFLEPLNPGQYVYQPLFQFFLERMAKERLSEWQDIHAQAASYYQQQGDIESTIYHLLEIGNNEQAAVALRDASGGWLKQGRGRVILNWLLRLPPLYQKMPAFLEIQADACRQTGRFDDAICLYQQAERAFQANNDLEGQSRSLRGQAEVYLDTVQPAPADALLKQALKLLPRDRLIDRAEILLLQAENWANCGRADVAFYLNRAAHRLAQQAQPEGTTTMDTTDSHLILSTVPSLSPRLLLRSGRLNESRRLLETELGLETPQVPVQRPITLAHREPLLLLALIYAFLGSGARTLAMALRGLLEAQHSGSQITEAVAHTRVGHAHQVVAPLDIAAAQRHYACAFDLVQQSGVNRTKVEALMGQTLLYGHSGNLVEAERVASEGLHIAQTAGDQWIAALIHLALGGAAVAVGDIHAIGWLEQADQQFVRGNDSYGQAVVALWRSLWYLHQSADDQVNEHVAKLLQLSQAHGYEGLLSAPTLFGPRDMAMLIPLLLRGRSLQPTATYAQILLRQAFPTIAADETVEDYHPGYTLRIQMLGSFRVWRGSSEIQSREWQREKARQLLQLLLTYRGQWIQREQICAWLWPESDLDASERQFKVTLNALNTALEPLRPPRTTPFFVRRQGLAYSFAPSYGCWIDVDEFELRTTNVPRTDTDFVLRNAHVAVSLYKGDYLTESLYDSWTLEERERLLARYLATATVLADRLVKEGDMEQAVQMCEQVLRRDRCYEEAYQVLMRAYARSGSRSQALRSYTRCVQALIDDLGIEPLPETTSLYERIKRNEKV